MKISRSTIFLLLLSSITIMNFLSCQGKEDSNEAAQVSFKVDNLVEVENASIPLSFNVNIDNPEHQGGTISIAISGGVYGTDYETTTGAAEFTLDIAPNVLLASFAIMPIDDELIEDDLTLTIAISAVSGALQLGEQTTTTLTILDDDKAAEPISINFTEATTAFSEGDPLEKLVYLNLSESLTEEANITIVLQSTTIAEIGTDFLLNGGTDNSILLTLPAGLTETSFTVSMIDDAIEEEDEVIVFGLENPSANLELGTAQTDLTATIIDNDAAAGPIDYFENFESYDGTSVYLNDVLGFQNVLVNQTVDAAELIKLVNSADNFADETDPTMPSDHGLNLFYNSDQDPMLFGELDNVVISPLMEGEGLIEINLDVAYAFANQNSGAVTFYWSETYDGAGSFDQSQWEELGTETVATMSDAGFGNNTYKRESFNINANQSFYVAIRLSQTIDDEFYRTRWRFDNLKVSN